MFNLIPLVKISIAIAVGATFLRVIGCVSTRKLDSAGPSLASWASDFYVRATITVNFSFISPLNNDELTTYER